MTQTPKKTTTRKPRVSKAKVKLPPNPFMHEILELVDEQKTKAKKVSILKEYRDDALTAILIWQFDDSVQSAMPEGPVPYKPNEVPVGTDHTSLRREWKSLYHFIRGGNDGLNNLRRETMFVQMLEGLHPREAEILVLIKDKDLETKYSVSFDNVKQAYPNMTWGGRS